MTAYTRTILEQLVQRLAEPHRFLQVLAGARQAGNRRASLPGIAAFEKAHGPAKKLLVGTGGIPFGEFLQIPRECFSDKLTASTICAL